MKQEIEINKRNSIATLNAALEKECADDLIEVLINLENGTCDYDELIPYLEKVAHVDWFYYFDDNGAGGMPHADLGRKTSFKAWALKAIHNIRENQALDSSTMIHEALKSNSTALIKATLEKLSSENKIADRSLIPILEKIARKNIYNKYSYVGGFQKECELSGLANGVIRIIQSHHASTDEHLTTKEDRSRRVCPECVSIPDDLTVNTGRGENFPAAFSKLISVDNDYRAEFRRCPSCRAYFQWIDMPQMYGSGNNDEERLIKIPEEQSRLLDEIFTSKPDFQPRPEEIEKIVSILPLELLVPALRFHLHGTSELIEAFLPTLLRILGEKNDTALWELLQGYISVHPARAEKLLDTFQSSKEYPPNRLTQIIHECLRILKKGK
jgi:hypothetical protein